MSSPSDAEVIGRSLGEPEALGLIYDRHAATLDLEGHRWRFRQRMRQVPSTK